MIDTLVIDTHSFDQRLSFTLQRESAIDCWPQFRTSNEGGAKPRRLGCHRRLRSADVIGVGGMRVSGLAAYLRHACRTRAPVVVSKWAQTTHVLPIARLLVKA